jgi:hypothetical protein
MGIDGNEIADCLARQGSSGTGRVGNMRSTGIPYVDKGRLRAFLKNPLQESW